MRFWDVEPENLPYSFEDVVSVFWNRYPNSKAPHIISDDVLERKVCGDQIITKKLIVKKGGFFLKAAPKWIAGIKDLQIVPTIEESVFDRKTRSLKTYTRNVSSISLFRMHEKCLYKASQECVEDGRNGLTSHTTLQRSLWVSVIYGRIGRFIESIIMLSFRKSITRSVSGLREKLELRYGIRMPKFISKDLCPAKTVELGNKLRYYLRLIEQPFGSLPVDLILQTLLSLLLVVYGASYVTGDFQPIRSDIQNRARSWDTVGSCSSFYNFHHRAKAISPTFAAFNRHSFSSQQSLHQGSNNCHLLSQCFMGTERVARYVTTSKAKSNALASDEKATRDALNHCVELTRKHDYANYLSTLLMPSSQRSAVFSLLAFNIEIALVRDRIQRNSGIAEIARLQFWKDAVESIYVIENGIIPRQPVAIALNCYAKSANLSLLKLLITSRQGTLGDRPFASTTAVSEYGVQTYASVIKLTMDELSRDNTGTNSLMKEIAADAADRMGEAMAFINLLRTIAPLLSRGIVLLPSDLLKLHNLKAEEIYVRRVSSLRLSSVARDLCHLSEMSLQRSRVHVAELNDCFKIALLAYGATIDCILKVSKRNNYDISDHNLQKFSSSVPWRFLWYRTIGKY